jgi:hypothetical protein
MSTTFDDRQVPAKALGEHADRVDWRFSVGIAVEHPDRDTLTGNPVRYSMQPDAKHAPLQRPAIRPPVVQDPISRHVRRKAASKQRGYTSPEGPCSTHDGSERRAQARMTNRNPRQRRQRDDV